MGLKQKVEDFVFEEEDLLKSDQNGIETPLNPLNPLLIQTLKSDQNGIETHAKAQRKDRRYS